MECSISIVSIIIIITNTHTYIHLPGSGWYGMLSDQTPVVVVVVVESSGRVVVCSSGSCSGGSGGVVSKAQYNYITTGLYLCVLYRSPHN